MTGPAKEIFGDLEEENSELRERGEEESFGNKERGFRTVRWKFPPNT